MLKQLYYGSLQDHMRASRRSMDQSFALQQQQLMRMNIMRESQRMMLTQAETLVRLNQLRDEVIKALPPKNVKVVIPTSNAALEETLSRSKQTQVTMEEEPEGKRAPPKSLKVSTSNSPKGLTVADLEVVRNAGGSPSKAKAASKPSSPVPSLAPSLAPTAATDFSEQLGDTESQVMALKRAFNDLTKTDKAKIKDASTQDALILISNFGGPADFKNEVKLNRLKTAFKTIFTKFPPNKTGKEFLNLTPEALYAYDQLIGQSGSGLKRLRAKSGRFVKSKKR